MKFTKITKYFIPMKIRIKIKNLIKKIIQNWIKIDSQNQIISENQREILRDRYYNDVISLKNILKYNFSEWEDFKN